MRCAVKLHIRLKFQVAIISALLAVNATTTAAEKSTKAKPKKADRADAFFADPTVRVFDIELSEAAAGLLKVTPRHYVVGTVREGTEVFTNIGIHLKGMGSFRSLDDQPSFVLKFDHGNSTQEHCGLTKLMLNNSVQDQTYICELLATQLFRDARVPAARVTQARVR